MAGGTAAKGIVTSVIPYGEKDLVVRIFFEGRGRVAAFARGGRSSRKRFPLLQPLAVGQFDIKEQRGDRLPQLQEADLDLDVDGLADPETFGRASYAVELVEKLVPERLPSPMVFGDLMAAIARIATGEGYSVLRHYELRLLSETGYLFDTNVHEDDVAHFDLIRFEIDEQESNKSVALSKDLCRAIEKMAAASVDITVPISLDDATVLARIFKAHLRRMSVGALRSTAYLRSLREVLHKESP